MDVLTLKDAILSSNSRCFTVKFLKVDGTIRTMLAKVGIKRYTGKCRTYIRKGKKHPYTRNCLETIVVFDMESKSYKSLRINSILEYRCGFKVMKRDWVGIYMQPCGLKRGKVDYRALVVENTVETHTELLMGVCNHFGEKEVYKVRKDSEHFENYRLKVN